MNATATRQQFWQTQIKECQSSTMSAKQWCRENQVAYSTYLYWVRKFKTASEHETRPHPETPVFAQLPSEQDILKITQKVEAPVSMFLGNVRIELSSACPQDLLRSLFEILNQYA